MNKVLRKSLQRTWSLKILLGCGMMFGNFPVQVYGDVFFKSEERVGVRLILKPQLEEPKRFQIKVEEVDEEPALGRAFSTRFFYDELAAVRRITVVEEKTAAVWGVVTTTERLAVDFYRNGVPRRLIEKIAWVGGRELKLDNLGRITEQRVFFYQTDFARGANGYKTARTFREVYVYDDTDVIIEKDVYKNGVLEYKQTRTLPVQTEWGETFRENYFDPMRRLVRYEEVLRTVISPTGYKEKRTRYGSSRQLLGNYMYYYHMGQLIREVLDDEEEITYRYDAFGRLKEKKRENLRERAIAQYYQYDYQQFKGIDTPLVFKIPTRYTLENLKLYVGDEILEQYRLLRIHGMHPVRMTVWVKPVRERERYPESIVETRVEKYFLPKRVLAFWFRNNVLYEKQVSTIGGRILGSYKYVYDEHARLKASLFYETGYAFAPSKKTVRYLYKDAAGLQEEVKASGVLFRTGNWEYFGHSLFRYLETQQRRLAQMTTQDFVRDFAVFRERSGEPFSKLTEELPADRTETHILTYLKYLTQVKLSRVLFINESGSVEYYLKFQNFPIENGTARLVIRYYKGEPQFQYHQARMVPTVSPDTGERSPKVRRELRGERHAFLTGGSLELNEVYAEKLLAKFTFVYNSQDLLFEGANDAKQPFVQRLPQYAQRQVYDDVSGEQLNATSIEQSVFLKMRVYPQEANRYERDFEKQILPFIE